MPKQAAPSSVSTAKKGLRIERFFTTAEGGPYAGIEWEKRSSVITERDGKIVFEMHDIEVPKTWSQLATDILASKYIRKAGVPKTGHETGARQVVERITHTVRDHAESIGAFASPEDAQAFEDELTYLLITQRAAFNSPVWFNCGLYHAYGIDSGSGGSFYWDPKTSSVQTTTNSYERPQCSACFIQKVGDSLEDIFELVKSESRLFKYGSGTGSNFSNLRSRYEKLSGGGTSSGVLSFLEVLDRAAGSIKSGGTTRRAAKMVILDVDHPEIEDFITWKVREEKKVAALIAAGYSADFNGEAYHTVSGQNANNSVRVNDEYMEAVLNDRDWETRARTTGEVVKTFKARDLWNTLGEAAWACADPGVQYDTTINRWHTCPNTDRINGSNPCSEYMFLDDTACNLASLNLMLFAREDRSFDTKAYEAANRIVFMAQEFIVDLSSYPTEPIARNSYEYRPLGLGYANLGTLLMDQGIPYDSDEGRATAAAITSLMNATGYRTSAELASVLGPFAGYEKNREPMLKVMNMHREHAYRIDQAKVSPELYEAATRVSDEMVADGEQYGYRNAQATVLAPTGTIGLLMDCDTTGIEPDFSIVKWKKLAGGGYLKIVNSSLTSALENLGYDEAQVGAIVTHVLGAGTLDGAPHVNPAALLQLGYTEDEIKAANDYVRSYKNLDQHTPNVNPEELSKRGLSAEQIHDAVMYVGGAQTVEGAPFLKEEHLAVFDCANKCGDGTRYIAPLGHVRMMGAVQPFLSGAISKTVNMPNEVSVAEVQEMYMEGWKLGLKAVAIYRDGCKLSQPLSSGKSDKTTTAAEAVATYDGHRWGDKRPVPQKRGGFTVESEVGGQKLFIRTGEYEDGTLAEVFIDVAKQGSSYNALLDCFAIAVSTGLQHGVPLDKFVEKFTFTRFEPSGYTTHPNIKTSTSVIDFIFRVLGMEYLGRTDFAHVPPTADQIGIPAHGRRAMDYAAPIDAAPMVSDVPASAATPAQHDEQVLNQLSAQLSKMSGDAPLCPTCGNVTVRNAACYKCLNCGNSLGCS